MVSMWVGNLAVNLAVNLATHWVDQKAVMKVEKMDNS